MKNGHGIWSVECVDSVYVRVTEYSDKRISDYRFDLMGIREVRTHKGNAEQEQDFLYIRVSCQQLIE
jgi:hypothetical protein